MYLLKETQHIISILKGFISKNNRIYGIIIDFIKLSHYLIMKVFAGWLTDMSRNNQDQT